ncbi:MAG: hypothetical protein WCV99_00680 [Sterolibacterium sp.]
MRLKLLVCLIGIGLLSPLVAQERVDPSLTRALAEASPRPASSPPAVVPKASVSDISLQSPVASNQVMPQSGQGGQGVSKGHQAKKGHKKAKKASSPGKHKKSSKHNSKKKKSKKAKS